MVESWELMAGAAAGAALWRAEGESVWWLIEGCASIAKALEDNWLSVG